MTRETRHLEREIKFATDFSFELPDLRKVVGSTKRLPEQSLRTAYFDTPDLRLWQRGITLRHRSGEDGHLGTWTLKLPEAVAMRRLDRSELSWVGEQREIPKEAARVLAGILRRATLGRIVVLKSTRRRLELRNESGLALGELDDDVVKVIKGATKGKRFRQIEFEHGNGLTGPEEHVVEAVVQRMCRAGAQFDRDQKFAKSLGLRKSTQRSKRQRGKHASLRDVVRLSVDDALERLLDYDYRLRLERSDPPAHAIHQARVATRRLRSDLRTFRHILDPIWLNHTMTELKWLGERLGKVRDADVLAGRIGTDDEAGPRDSALRLRLAEQRSSCTAELAAAMESDRYTSLLERLHAASHMPPIYAGKQSRHAVRADDLARDYLPKLVHRQWKTLRHRVHKAGSNPTDRELHRIRIASKQLRYAAETASPVIGKAARRTARRAAHLQTILGEHHDAVAAEQWLELVARDGSGAAGFAAGLLAATERRQQSRLRRKWKSTWGEIATDESTRWLR